MSDGGKGSAPRKQQDQDAYSKNYEAIFGKKKEAVDVPLALKDWSYEEQKEKARENK
jgi:hypothetical protein